VSGNTDSLYKTRCDPRSNQSVPSHTEDMFETGQNTNGTFQDTFETDQNMFETLDVDIHRVQCFLRGFDPDDLNEVDVSITLGENQVANWTNMECMSWAQEVCIKLGIPIEQLEQTAFRSLTGRDLITYTQSQYRRLLGSHLGRVLHQRLHQEIRPNHGVQVEQQQQQQQQQHDDDDDDDDDERGGSPLIFQELQNAKIEKEFGDFESNETLHSSLSPHPSPSSLSPHPSLTSLSPHPSPTSLSPHPSLTSHSPHPSISSLSPHPSPSSLSPHPSPSSLSPHPSISYSPPFSLTPHPFPSLTSHSPRPSSSSYSPPFLPPHPSPSYSPPSSLSPHPSPSNSPPSYPFLISTSPSPPSPIESESGLGVTGEGDKMAFCFALRKIKVRGRNREREPKNVEFLCRLLCCNERKITNTDFVQWEDKSQATFRLMKNNLIALVWGRRRQFFNEGNNTIDDVLRDMGRVRGRRSAKELEDLTYNNFARGLRYHYNSDFIRSVVERQLVYQWGPKALQFMRSEAETLRALIDDYQ
ncbi:hypothetical protein Pmani_012606, partial [Petrolisthes manimaculis]